MTYPRMTAGMLGTVLLVSLHNRFSTRNIREHVEREKAAKEQFGTRNPHLQGNPELAAEQRAKYGDSRPNQ